MSKFAEPSHSGAGSWRERSTASGSKPPGPAGSQKAAAASGLAANSDNKDQQQSAPPATTIAPNQASGAPLTQTSGTHRLGSIEILNENKQRQLQLKQQESFKQHLEQRQKFIQQQQGDLTTYQFNTSAPDYARMATSDGVGHQAPANKLAASELGAPGNRKSAGIAVNPFDDDSFKRQQQQQHFGRKLATAGSLSPDDGDKSATVSGKSGFLAALMDGDASGADGPNKADESSEELDTATGGRMNEPTTRYSKVAQAGSCSYNYDEDPSRKPFFQRDWATILQECRTSRKLVILIVAIALLLDNMLLTSVVPIIPAYLYRLRVERQHRELLANGNKSASFQTDRLAGRFSSLDTNRDGRLDEAEIQAELERRVNQSLAAAQDRFSGSVFQPRVLRPRTGAGAAHDDNNDDDGDDDDDNDQTPSGHARPLGERGRVPRARAPPARQSQGSIEDEYEEAAERSDAPKARKAPSDKPTTGAPKKVDGARRTAVRPATARGPGARRAGDEQPDDGDGDADAQIGAKSKSADDDNDADDDDADDEDLADAQKWMKLKSALVSMATISGNDSDTLGGMCLSMVLGRPNYFERRFGAPDGLRNDARNAKNGATNVNDDDDGSADKDQDEDIQAEEEAASTRRPEVGQRKGLQRARGPESSLVRRPEKVVKVERLRPKTSTPKPMAKPKQEADKDGTNGGGELKDDELIINHQDIVDESFEVGVMFASKPIVQAIANPFVGTITNRVGFTLPMFLGFTIMFLSTLVFAFGTTYETLFLARAIQGVGSACTSVAGMSMIADRFPDDAERGNAMAIALGGLALGVVIGPPFGGFMYEFFGKPSPFIVLAILALLDGLLQLLVLQPRVTRSQEEGASLMTLIKDPYILVAAGAITFANTGIGILEPALPLWMMDTMQAKNWEQGVAFLPAALSYLFSTNLFGNWGLRIGRWRSAMLGLIIIGCSLLLIPFATRVDHLILPNGAIGFAIGMVDSTMMPMLGYLVDIRHTSVYGSVYAIGDVAFCASFVFGKRSWVPKLASRLIIVVTYSHSSNLTQNAYLPLPRLCHPHLSSAYYWQFTGPALSGTLVELIGFEGLVVTTALICFGFAPLLLLLRNPPAKQMDQTQLQEQSTMRYVNYNHLDSPDEEAQLTADSRAKSKSYVR